MALVGREGVTHGDADEKDNDGFCARLPEYAHRVSLASTGAIFE
jgi:hypothetical protein